jgi:hypothetical protein
MPRFGMLLSLVLFAGSFASLATRPAPAAVKEFPYEAIIEADEAYVRCGPGKNFYTTLKLTRGQHVTVRRHDPGGWFMIDPPVGSFSLIRVEDVVQEGNVATVKRLEQGQACVRIGSSLDPTAESIFQRKLSSGERAEILGEVIVSRKDRQVPMFRITPPRGEFRWIEGSDVAPLDPQIKQQQESDPFSTPPQAHVTRPATNNPTPTTTNQTPTNNHPPTTVSSIATSSISTSPQPATRPATQPTASKNGSASTSHAKAGNASNQVVIQPANFDPRTRLDQIDGQFREMIQKEPPTWNLGQIEQAYLELRRHPAAAGVAGQVDLRFSALAHYKQVKSQYDDYYRLVSATSRRDAELAAVENSLAPQNSRPAIGPNGQGGWPSTTSGTTDPATNATYQTPVPASNPTVPMNVPNYSQQGSPGSPALGQPNFLPPNAGTLNASNLNPGNLNPGLANGAQMPSQPSFTPAGVNPQSVNPQFGNPKPPTGISTNWQAQNGATLGAPIAMPLENKGDVNSTPNLARSDSASPPNAAPAPSNAVITTDSPHRHTAQSGNVPTEPASDLGIQSFAGEIGPGQSAPAQPGNRTHTSQFAPEGTGQPQVPATSPSSAPVTLQTPLNISPAPAPGQSGAPPMVSSSGPMQLEPTGQPSPEYGADHHSGGAPPFAAQQPGLTQPQNQQPTGQQSTSQQPPMTQPSLPQPALAQPPAQQFASPPSYGQQPNFQLDTQPNATAPGGGAMPPMAPPRQIRPPSSPPLDGAGVVQRAASTFQNGPRHVLLAPNGRILAYRGVNLDAYVGREMGVMGARAFHPQLQTDLIIVRGIVPVRLVHQ